MLLDSVGQLPQVQIEYHSDVPRFNQANVNEVNVVDVLLRYKGSSPIREAARANDIPAVKLLLLQGADSHQALLGAIEGRSLPLVEYLIKEVRTSAEGWDISFTAAGWWEGFDYLVLNGAEAYIVSPQNQYLLSAVLQDLMTPESRFTVDDIYQLRMRGAEVRGCCYGSNICHFSKLFLSSFDRQKRIDIFNAIAEFFPDRSLVRRMGYLDQEFVICRKGDSVKDWGWKLVPDRKSHEKRCTLLLAAIWSEDVELVIALLRVGADPNANSPHGGGKPLAKAIQLENKEIMALLIEYGAIP